MSELGMYLVRNTDYCAETRNLIEDVIVGVQNNPFMPEFMKKELLQDQLKGMGFNDEQLTAFVQGKIPTEYKLVPVDAKIERYYRTYVRVPVYEVSNDAVRTAAKKQIVNEQDKCIELDPDLDIEEDDIEVVCIDWDGEQYE